MIFNNESEIFIQNSNITNLTENSNLIWIGNTQSVVRLYNTNGFSNGSEGYFIDANSELNVSIHNVRSNKDNNLLIGDLFEPSGFIYDSNFYLPNF
jgi:ligand-binding sensor domain-containing protein